MADDDDNEDTQWTASARIAFVAAGDDLLAAISAQLDFLASAELGTPWKEIRTINEAVEHAALAYSDAQLDLTGNSYPFGGLKKWEDEDEDDEGDEDEDEDDAQPTMVLSVLQRADYGVLDEEAVLEAARKKFLDNRPGESVTNAQSTVSHLGAALYELAHAEGWDSLDKAPGLTPLGSIIQAIVPDDAIEFLDAQSEADEPDVSFSVEGKVLYTEQNRYF